MSTRIEWAELRSTTPQLSPPEEFRDGYGTTNDDWALAVGEGAVLEGSLEEWREWAVKLLADIDETIKQEEEEEEEEPEPERFVAVHIPSVFVDGAAVTLELKLVVEEPDYGAVISDNDAERVVFLWAEAAGRTAEWHLEKDAILGWRDDDGEVHVGVWGEFDTAEYNLDDFPAPGMKYTIESAD